MKMAIALTMVAGLLGAGAVQAAPTVQQQKMTTCSTQAKAQSLKGDQRKSFMSNCLKKDSAMSSEGKMLTPQQTKMKSCNMNANTQNLKGDARKAFMSSCLKKS